MQEIIYRNCFVCGQDNPIGLKLPFYYTEDTAFTYFDSPSSYEGYEGIIHGGIISALLDEVMAKIIIKKGIIAVTAEMNIKYRNPLPVGHRVLLKGEITQQKSRIIHTKATLSDEHGKVFAESTAVYIAIKKL